MELHPEPITISVLIATFNRAHMLTETLDSILAQTQVPDEIVVINDGSTDDTEAVLQPYMDRIVYMKQKNGGRSSALNAGLQQATSSHIWLFDDDDIALPHAVETHRAFLSAHPDADFSYSPCYYFTGEFSAQALADQPEPSLPRIDPDHYLLMILEDMRGSMPGMLIPRRCYQTVGLFDEALLRSQDHDMVIRLARCFRAGRMDKPTFAVRSHDGVRGPGFAQHDGARRFMVWREYQQRIYRRVLEQLALEEYLPRTDRSGHSMTSSERRRAFLQRAYILANRGLYPEALRDLEASARETPDDSRVMPAAEQRLFSAITLVGERGDIGPTRFYARLGRLAPLRVGTLRPLCRGVYWSGVKHRTRPLVFSRICVRSTALIVGYLYGPPRREPLAAQQ